MGLLTGSKDTKVVVYKICDLPQLVKTEMWEEVMTLIKVTGIDIKYADMNQARKRSQLNELRQLAYSVQRDMKAVQQDTGELRGIIKGLSVGSNY
jgi:hypothetical protein